MKWHGAMEEGGQGGDEAFFVPPFICDLVSRVAASIKAATRGRKVEPQVPPPLADELMPRGGVLKIHLMRPVQCTGSIPALVNNGFWDAGGSFSPGLGHPLHLYALGF